MSEKPPLLLPHFENAVSARTLGMIQEEIGALTTTLFQERAKIEAYEAQRAQDIIAIDTLKQRLSGMESDRIEMKATIEQLRSQIPASRRKKIQDR